MLLVYLVLLEARTSLGITVWSNEKGIPRLDSGCFSVRDRSLRAEGTKCLPWLDRICLYVCFFLCVCVGISLLMTLRCTNTSGKVKWVSGHWDNRPMVSQVLASCCGCWVLLTGSFLPNQYLSWGEEGGKSLAERGRRTLSLVTIVGRSTDTSLLQVAVRFN